jgi:hypothetical protein
VQTFSWFAPWIAFMVLSSNNRFELGAVVALVIAVVMLGVQHRSGQKPTPFDYATLGFFTLLVIVGLFANDATVATWVQPVANFALFAIALVSILIGKPFTRQYARQSLPPEVWDSPGFLQGTLQVAWVWVAAFAVMTVSSLITVFQPDSETWTTWVVPIAPFVGAILYTAPSRPAALPAPRPPARPDARVACSPTSSADDCGGFLLFSR